MPQANRKPLNFDELRRIPIVTVLSRYNVQLRATGKGLHGPCPLPSHVGENKKEPFSVNTEDNYWQCFSPKCAENRGGKRGGDVINFVMAKECTEDYYSAAELLKSWYGGGEVQFPRAVPNPKKVDAGEVVEETAPLVNIPLEERWGKGKGQLSGIEYDHPYLAERGFSPDLCESFGVGYFTGKGTMSGRIVFPIHNSKGELLAYCGRLVDPDKAWRPKDAPADFEPPRWQQPPNFHRSIELYNLHRVPFVSDEIILFESFWGVLAAARAGLDMAVALMGSSISDEQFEVLRGYGKVILCMDGDEPGRAATRAIAPKLMELEKGSVKVVWLPTGKQPDELEPDALIDYLF